MSPLLPMRDYQIEATDAVEAAWAGGMQRPAVVLPTGMGKTVAFAHLAARAVAAGRRVLVLVHREELAQQAADKLRSVMPGASVGIVKAARDEVGADVAVASVQTLSRAGRMERYLAATAGAPRLVIVDEAHHAAARTWTAVLRDLGAFGADEKCITCGGGGEDYYGGNVSKCQECGGVGTVWSSDTLAVGFTATMHRDTRTAGPGLGDVWEEVVYERDILYGIEHGYLVDPRGVRVTVTDLDLSRVKQTGGDYQEKALGAALEDSAAGEVIAKAYAEHAAGRPAVVFAPTVATAHDFADHLDAVGYPTGVIHGDLPHDEREALYRKFRAGELAALSNCQVLTEGWDAPWCSCAIIARPTQSPGLYIQMVGRVLRPFPGKSDALVLDVVGASAEHALGSLTALTTYDLPVVLDGESLAEAVVRHAAEQAEADAADAARRPARPGAVAFTSSDVDLFHRSTSVWLRTYAGTWFIPTDMWTYFLWPQEDGRWKVGRKPTYRAPRDVRGGWLQTDLDLGYAMAWGEADAAAHDTGSASLASKKAAWRRPGQKPSPAQLDMVARYGLEVSEDASKADVSDLISVHIASRDLDPRPGRR